MSLRIAYMTGEYPRATDTFIQREIASLRASGVHIETISIRQTPIDEHVGPEQRSEAEQTCYILPISPVRVLVSHLKFLFVSPRRWITALRLAWKTRAHGFGATMRQGAYFLEAALVARYVNRNRLTHLHNHFANSSCTVAMIAAAMGGFTFSFTIHGPAIFFEPQRWRIDEKCRRALFVSCISAYCRSQTMIWAPLESWNRLHIIHCGVDPQKYLSHKHSGQGTQLMFVGRLAAVKGLPILLDAMKQLVQKHSKLKLTVVGDGPDRIALEKRTRHLGLGDHVEFVGKKSQSEVAEQLSHTDIFVLPSFAEGVPVVLMEAMAAGVPVIATRIAGIAELVDDGNSGFLVPPSDVGALADRIHQLLEDAELRESMGQAGRESVQQEFNIQTEAGRLLAVLSARLAGNECAIRPTIDANPSSDRAVNTDQLSDSDGADSVDTVASNGIPVR